MIIIRQKIFNKIDFDYYEYHEKKGDLSPEDAEKFKALKKRYKNEWEDHQRRNSSGQSSKTYDGSSSSGGSYNYGSGYKSSSSSSSSSSKSKGSEDFDWDKWNKDFEESRKKYREDFERNRKKTEDSWREHQEDVERIRREREEREKGFEHDMDQLNKSTSMARAANYLWGGKVIGKLTAKKIRRDRVNAKVGLDKNMKDSDRDRIEELKVMPDIDKKLLKTIAEGKDKNEVKKAERQYRIRKSAIGALDKAVTGASIGGDIGVIYDIGKVANTSKFGTSKGVDRTARGMGYGSLGGAIFGAGLNAYRANKQINKVKNSKNKERESDRIKVSSGKMTEHEFVKKHGARK